MKRGTRSNRQFAAHPQPCYRSAMSDTDTPSATPAPAVPDTSDLTEQFNTPLAPKDEAAFQTWAKALGSQGSSYDYDLRGAYKAGASQSANGHFTDQFKKPNHPTFSDQSQYSTPEAPGGSWVQDPATKAWTFTTSPFQAKYHTPEDLQSYFSRVEKGNKLVVQPPTMLDALSKALNELSVGENGPK